MKKRNISLIIERMNWMESAKISIDTIDLFKRPCIEICLSTDIGGQNLALGISLRYMQLSINPVLYSPLPLRRLPLICHGPKPNPFGPPCLLHICSISSMKSLKLKYPHCYNNNCPASWKTMRFKI